MFTTNCRILMDFDGLFGRCGVTIPQREGARVRLFEHSMQSSGSKLQPDKPKQDKCGHTHNVNSRRSCTIQTEPQWNQHKVKKLPHTLPARAAAVSCVSPLASTSFRGSSSLKGFGCQGNSAPAWQQHDRQTEPPQKLGLSQQLSSN